MGFSYIEEDFRFTTAPQVDRYTAEDRGIKPNLPGFALTQLLDQLNGQRWARTSHLFYLRASSGLAFWLTKHWQELETPPQMLLSIEPQDVDSRVVQQIREMKGVRRVEITDTPFDLALSCEVTCTVLACSSELAKWYQHVETHPVLQLRPLLVYDRHRTLRDEGVGEYFMNSSIWVNHRYAY